jgi:predicted amidohydrolase
MVSRDDEGRLVNRFWLFGPNGSPPITYDKAHLFEPMLEHRYLAPGCRRVRTTVGPFTASLTICFDLRFPEQYRLDATQGADLYLCVAEWPAERAEAMRLFARARAAENQAYLALCNRVGVARDGTRFGGASLVVAPDGSVVAEGGHSEEIVRAELDRAEITALRGRLKVLGARRANVDYDRPPEP